MGSSSKRLAWLGAWIGALLLATAIVSAAGTASATKVRPHAERGGEQCHASRASPGKAGFAVGRVV